jgi:hypothetical protein
MFCTGHKLLRFAVTILMYAICCVRSHSSGPLLQKQMTEVNLFALLINLLNPTVHVMHQQFNIQQLYFLPTLYLCVLYLSENKQRHVPLTA